MDIIDWKAVVVVSGSTKTNACKKKYLINRFDSLDIPLIKATFDNPYLFQSTLFGNFIRMQTSRWQHTSTIESFAELNFFTSLHAGTKLGFTLDEWIQLWKKKKIENLLFLVQKFNFMNMLLANKQNVDGKKTNNPHWALTGDTGNGKSVTAKTLFMQMALLKDRVLYIDPKRNAKAIYVYNQ